MPSSSPDLRATQQPPAWTTPGTRDPPAASAGAASRRARKRCAPQEAESARGRRYVVHGEVRASIDAVARESSKPRSRMSSSCIRQHLDQHRTGCARSRCEPQIGDIARFTRSGRELASYAGLVRARRTQRGSQLGMVGLPGKDRPGCGTCSSKRRSDAMKRSDGVSANGAADSRTAKGCTRRGSRWRVRCVGKSHESGHGRYDVLSTDGDRRDA